MPTNNHYGSVLNANVFFDNRLHCFYWDRSSPSDRIKAMNWATQLIDQFNYVGQKYAVAMLAETATEEECRQASLSQEHEFPRGTVNEVPVDVEHATYLIAERLLAGRDPNADLENLGTKSSAYGDVKTVYVRDGNILEHIAHLIPSAEAFNKLRPFFRERDSFNYPPDEGARYS